MIWREPVEDGVEVMARRSCWEPQSLRKGPPHQAQKA
jgi:hypothetical protein